MDGSKWFDLNEWTRWDIGIFFLSLLVVHKESEHVNIDNNNQYIKKSRKKVGYFLMN